MRTISPPLPSSASAQTLSDPHPSDSSKYLAGDLMPLQAFKSDNSQLLPMGDNLSHAPGMVKLRSFPECLDRPVTFHAVKDAQLQLTTDDARIVRLPFSDLPGLNNGMIVHGEIEDVHG